MFYMYVPTDQLMHGDTDRTSPLLKQSLARYTGTLPGNPQADFD